MRSGLGFLAIIALGAAACSDDRAVAFAAKWGCGPVEGLAAIRGDAAPAWLLVGEFTETNEAPAAIADIACHLAADGRPLFVGISEYLGGATDAETAMVASLEDMIVKGAPLIVVRIGGEDHPYTVHDKSRAEKSWAEALMRKVSDAGAARSLLLLPHASAIAEHIPPIGDRFAGYSPMPVFLKGRVVSLEIAPSPAVGLPSPAIRMHPQMKNGFHGQLALNRMTRPTVDLVLPSPQPVSEARLNPALHQQRLDDEILRDAQALSRQYLDAGEIDLAPRVDDAPLQPELDLPEFVTE
jgi:hypothetical protein